MPIKSSGHRKHKGRRSFIALVRIIRNFGTLTILYSPYQTPWFHSLLCSTEDVVCIQPLKKLFHLHNLKVRNLSQLNPSNATAQCLALVLTVEVNDYSDWLNWWRIVSFVFYASNRQYEISGFRRKYTKTALFWANTQRVVLISYRRFGTTYRSHLERPIIG